jgi:hypothetical protein
MYYVYYLIKIKLYNARVSNLSIANTSVYDAKTLFRFISAIACMHVITTKFKRNIVWISEDISSAINILCNENNVEI